MIIIAQTEPEALRMRSSCGSTQSARMVSMLLSPKIYILLEKWGLRIYKGLGVCLFLQNQQSFWRGNAYYEKNLNRITVYGSDLPADKVQEPNKQTPPGTFLCVTQSFITFI